jgi:hypothetical protein
MRGSRTVVNAIGALAAMGLFSVAFAMLTPCSIVPAGELRHTIFVFEGCSIGLQFTGMGFGVVGAGLGILVGGVARRRLVP